MQFGIGLLNIVPLRKEPDDRSEMVSQVLFGEHFEIINESGTWSYVRLAYDFYEGWIDKKQYVLISELDYLRLNASSPCYSGELVDFLIHSSGELMTLSLGSNLPFYQNKKITINQSNYTFEGKIFETQVPKSEIIRIALMYLNTPYLWGGKTPFGIDCSGFTQMVYKLAGYHLLRDASQQASLGENLNFLEESEAGDLAFFDNEEGKIIHVGILMNSEQIIHSSGKVRIDYIDHSGIFNKELNKHTHKLRLLKKVI